MDALAQLLAAIISFIFEVTLHAIVFIFHLVMAIFSPRYREKLKDDWDTSTWKRLSLIMGVAMYSAAFVLALFFWIPALSRRAPETTDTERKALLKVEFTSENNQQTKTTIEFDGLVDAAGEIIKRKREERKEDKERNEQ